MSIFFWFLFGFCGMYLLILSFKLILSNVDNNYSILEFVLLSPLSYILCICFSFLGLFIVIPGVIFFTFSIIILLFDGNFNNISIVKWLVTPLGSKDKG